MSNHKATKIENGIYEYRGYRLTRIERYSSYNQWQVSGRGLTLSNYVFTNTLATAKQRVDHMIAVGSDVEVLATGNALAAANERVRALKAELEEAEQALEVAKAEAAVAIRNSGLVVRRNAGLSGQSAA